MKKPIEFNLGEFNRNSMQEIENVITNKIMKDKFDIVALIAPNQFSTLQNYAKIKRLCTLQKQIQSQYIRQQTVENTQLGLTSGSIMSQMAVKCGATMWVASPPNGLPEKTMIIGTSIQRVFVRGEQLQVVGLVASLDRNMTKFYSRAAFQKVKKEQIVNIGTLIIESIKQYFIQNKFVPEHIIFLRENIADSNIHKYLSSEVKEIIQSFSDLSPQYKPNLCVILLESRNGVRVFTRKEDTPQNQAEPTLSGAGLKESDQPPSIQNPPSGTIVDGSITSKYHYDFYMISQNVKSGTSAPVHYKIIYDTTGFPEGMLQELLYSQCFNYVNYTGSIKYPAQIQYAKKLARMIGTYIQEEVSEKLSTFKYYI